MGIDAHAGIVGPEPLMGKDCPTICATSGHTASVAGGVFAHGKAWLCCSRGIGLECGDAPRVRLNCWPQLVVLTLSGS
jgi:predicted MPP superfamily phosphohydrolase